MGIPAQTARRWGHAVEDLMSSLHPSALPMRGRDGFEHPFALPTVDADAPLSVAAEEFLRTGATILAVTDPETHEQIGLLLRRRLHRRVEESVSA